MEPIILLILGLISGLIYFIPSIIARKTKFYNGILILNIFLGWTFLGWVAALVWAVSAPKDNVVFYNSSTKIGVDKLQERFIYFFNNLFMKTETTTKYKNDEINHLMSKIKGGEAIIRNKLTDNYEIISAEKWRKILKAKKDDDYEIIEEK